MLPSLVRAFRESRGFRALRGALPVPGETLNLGGLPGSSAPVCVAALTEDNPQRTFLVVVASPVEAERWLADLTVLMGERVRLYPQLEALGEDEPHFEIAGERVETIAALLSGSVSVIVTTARATAERTALPAAVNATRVTLRLGDDIRPAAFVEELKSMGYADCPTVLDVAQFAVRGGIVDVYGFGMAAPMRVEWWGDEIASIRAFDLDSQRSEGEREAVTVLPIGAKRSEAKGSAPLESGAVVRQTLLSLVPPDTLVIVDAGADRASIEHVWTEAAHHIEVARRRGENAPDRSVLLSTPDAWERELRAMARLWLDAQPYEVDFRLHAPERVERDMKRLVAIIQAGSTLILCDNEGQLERLEELLTEGAGRFPPHATLAIGALHGGFVLPGLTVLTDHEIFRRARRIRRPRRYRQALSPSAAGALTPGDYVVHLEHGIGIYRGIETVTTEHHTVEVAQLEYEGGSLLNVPLYKLDQLERYRSAADQVSEVPPRLDRLGGTRWRRQRDKTRAAIQKMLAPAEPASTAAPVQDKKDENLEDLFK